jgi:hypothetical protein
LISIARKIIYNVRQSHNKWHIIRTAGTNPAGWSIPTPPLFLLVLKKYLPLSQYPAIIITKRAINAMMFKANMVFGSMIYTSFFFSISISLILDGIS